MSIEHAKDRPVQQGKTVAEKPSTKMNFSTRVDIPVEQELSDETLEAVAGGGSTSKSMPAAADCS